MYFKNKKQIQENQLPPTEMGLYKDHNFQVLKHSFFNREPYILNYKTF